MIFVGKVLMLRDRGLSNEMVCEASYLGKVERRDLQEELVEWPGLEEIRNKQDPCLDAKAPTGRFTAKGDPDGASGVAKISVVGDRMADHFGRCLSNDCELDEAVVPERLHELLGRWRQTSCSPTVDDGRIACNLVQRLERTGFHRAQRHSVCLELSYPWRGVGDRLGVRHDMPFLCQPRRTTRARRITGKCAVCSSPTSQLSHPPEQPQAWVEELRPEVPRPPTHGALPESQRQGVLWIRRGPSRLTPPTPGARPRRSEARARCGRRSRWRPCCGTPRTRTTGRSRRCRGAPTAGRR